MKVFVFLGLLAVAALALTQSEKDKLIFNLTPKLPGGPNFVPFFTRNWRPVAKPITPAPKNSSSLKSFIDEKIKNLHEWAKNKFSLKPSVLPAEAARKYIRVNPTPAPETSGFEEFGNFVRDGYNSGEKLRQFLKNKFSLKPSELPDAVEAGRKYFKDVPVQESSFVNLRKRVKAHTKIIKDAIKDHVEITREHLKDRFGKKEEIKEEIVPTPAPETSGLVEFGDFVRDGAKVRENLYKFLKNKFSLKPSELPDAIDAAYKNSWSYTDSRRPETSGLLNVLDRIVLKGAKMLDNVSHGLSAFS